MGLMSVRRLRLTEEESLHLAKIAIEDEVPALITEAFRIDKIETSEKLGDLLIEHNNFVDQALLAYYRAYVHDKILQCYFKFGEYKTIISYCVQSHFTTDFSSFLKMAVQRMMKGPFLTYPEKVALTPTEFAVTHPFFVYDFAYKLISSYFPNGNPLLQENQVGEILKLDGNVRSHLVERRTHWLNDLKRLQQGEE